MKWIAITLGSLTAMLGILYVAIGGTVLGITLAIIGSTGIVMGMFSLGVWYAHKSIQLGADLAIQAQSNNDQWDTVKTKALADFGSQMIKLKNQNTNNGFPLLEQGNDTFDASFTISGIDEEEEE
jgi:hypothetical protein